MTRKSERRFSGKTTALAGLLIAVALLAGGYGWIIRTSPASQAEPPEQVTIATNTAYVGSCPVIVAREKGYFASEGILAVVQPHSSGKAAMEAVLSGLARRLELARPAAGGGCGSTVSGARGGSAFRGFFAPRQ